MKSLVKITLISSAIVLALAGCDKKSGGTNLSISSATDAQKEAYALGSSYATYIKENLKQAQIDPESNSDYILQGFNDTYRGASQQTEDETKAIIKSFSERHQKEVAAKIEQEVKDNTEAGNKFREDFAKQKDVKQTKSGLLYQIIKPGNANHPKEEDIVVVNYTGTLTNGEKFDSSFDRGETATFPLQGVIKGWTEGIQLIGVGGKIKLVIPPELAYGNQSIPAGENTPGIPAASTLVFEVDLVGIGDDSNKGQEGKSETTPAQDAKEQPAK